MIKEPTKSEKSAQLTVTTKEHIIHDLKKMEQNTKIPVDVLVTKALMFFIATHNDYLGRHQSGK